MRIGIFTELYPPHIGGQEVRYAELAACMLRLGHSVDVYCVRHSTDVPEREIRDGVSIYRHPLATSYKQPIVKALRRKVIAMLRYSLWVRRMARAEQYDLMLFNQWPLAHVAFAKSVGRPKMVLDWCEVRSGWLYRAFIKWLPLFASKNIAVSMAVAKSVAAASGCPVNYVPSGVYLSNYHYKRREDRSGLIYLGRVFEHKNLALLIEAFELMKRGGYPGDLTIAGGGPELETLNRARKISPFSENIHLLGYVDEKTKVELLANSEVLVIPSRREGFPRVVAEGMASGLPTATVDFPDNGTKSVVSDYRIGIVAEPNAKALAAAIGDVMEDWDIYSGNCLKYRAELDWDYVVAKLLACENTAQPA